MANGASTSDLAPSAGASTFVSGPADPIDLAPLVIESTSHFAPSVLAPQLV